MKARLLLGTIALLVLGGCAHGMMRGSVAMKVSEREAHVCMGKGEVKEGDRVRLFRNVCRGGKFAGSAAAAAGCEKTALGEGTITKILNEHYSIVEFDPGVTFDEGTFVEKE